MWAILVLVCLVGVISIANPKAQELTGSAFWGIDQVINTFVGLLLAGALGWVSDHRFVIATCVVVGSAVDLLVLALVSSHRQAQAWRPRVRLGDWMEVPRPGAATAPLTVADPLLGVNRRLAAASAVAAASLLTWTVNLTILMRDLVIPREARRLAHATATASVESRARLESLRHTGAIRGDAREPELGRGANIKVLSGGQSIGWYGPLGPRAEATEEEDRDGKQHADRLAS